MSGTFHETQCLKFVAEAAAGGVGPALLSNAAATTVLATVTIPFRCEIAELHVVNKGTSTHATVFVLNFRNRPTAGTATGDSSIGTITRPTAATSTQGNDIYKRVATRTIMNPGSEIAIVVDTANGNACEVQAHVLVESVPEDPANLTSQVASA